MFTMPNDEKMQEMLEIMPDIIRNHVEHVDTYLARVKMMIVAHKFMTHIGVTLEYPVELTPEYCKRVVDGNDIPDFAVLETAGGEYKISFGDMWEEDPIIAVTRDFYDECTNGYIYFISEAEASKTAKKRMRECAIYWSKNVMTNKVEMFI